MLIRIPVEQSSRIRSRWAEYTSSSRKYSERISSVKEKKNGMINFLIIVIIQEGLRLQPLRILIKAFDKQRKAVVFHSHALYNHKQLGPDVR
jgi:hypothetical protein